MYYVYVNPLAVTTHPDPLGCFYPVFFLQAQVLSICVSAWLVALPRVAACWPGFLMVVGVVGGPYLSTPAKLPSTQRHSRPHHPSIPQLNKGLHRQPVLIF